MENIINNIFEFIAFYIDNLFQNSTFFISILVFWMIIRRDKREAWRDYSHRIAMEEEIAGYERTEAGKIIILLIKIEDILSKAVEYIRLISAAVVAIFVYLLFS